MTFEQVAACFRNFTPSSDGESGTALCPAHDDTANSLSIAKGENGRVLLKCHAGCEHKAVLAKAGLKPADVRGERKGRTKASDGPNEGLTLAQYAVAKKLPVEYLVRKWGLSERSSPNQSGGRSYFLCIPYFDSDGNEVAERYRSSLDGELRFRWKKRAKPCLYGLQNIEKARQVGTVIIVEGESDAQTLGLYGYPAVGLPGASNWREDRDAEHFGGIGTIYVIVEPDKGGRTMAKRLADSEISDRVRFVHLDGFKDPSALHIDDPERFKERFGAALASSVPFEEAELADKDARLRDSWKLCGPLAQVPDILGAFVTDLRRTGLVGEERAAKLLYLVLTSRLLAKPVSAVVKGPSSAGKSNLAQKTADFFPTDAYYALTSMSERALAYSEEPLKHRTLMLYEAAGMAGDFQTYLIRSLLSEGCIRYETVQKTAAGLEAKLIEREGPTNLIVTTTAASLHPENETRLLSIPVSDDPAQTKAILYALADESEREPVDLTRWHALQAWLTDSEHRVSVPFATALADMVPPVAVRLRRDFGAVLSLIRTHALLHQAQRARLDDDRIVATLADYAAVAELVADVIAEGAESSVPPSVRETVEAVASLVSTQANPHAEPTLFAVGNVSVTALAKRLGLDKSSASRRAKVALERGYLKNEETRRGRAARYALGDPMPGEVVVLPSVECLAARISAMRSEERSHRDAA